MRIGLLVDGRAEFESLPLLLPRCGSPHQLRPVLKADLQPGAPAGRNAHEIVKKLGVFRGVDHVIVLLDREGDIRCPASLAGELEGEVRRRVADPLVSVVIKDRTFENWLIGDLDVFRAMRSRFTITGGMRNQVTPDKADATNAMAWLTQATGRSGHYEKLRDATAIAKVARPNTIALNSRSFRRFMRTVEHPRYRRQSKDPNP